MPLASWTPVATPDASDDDALPDATVDDADREEALRAGVVLEPGAADAGKPSAFIAANDELLPLVKLDRVGVGFGVAPIVSDRPAPNAFMAASDELLLLVKLVRFASGRGLLGDPSNVKGTGSGKLRFADLIGGCGGRGMAGAG